MIGEIEGIDRFGESVARSACGCCPVTVRRVYAVNGRKPSWRQPFDYVFNNAESDGHSGAGYLYRDEFPKIVEFIDRGGVDAYNAIVDVINGGRTSVYSVGSVTPQCAAHL